MSSPEWVSAAPPHTVGLFCPRNCQYSFPIASSMRLSCALTSGRGIFAACRDSNAHLQEDWVSLDGMVQFLPSHLAPAAQEALSTLPAPPEEHMGESQAEAWAASLGKAIPQRHVFGGPEREVRRNFNERPNKRGMGLRIESHPLLIAETRCDGRLPTSPFLTSSEVLNEGMKFPIRPSKNTSGLPVYLGYGIQRPRVFR
jgi:hypothetical protein